MATLLTGCGNKVELEVGYQPPFVPIRIGINTQGEIDVSLSAEFATPIGTFDIETSRAFDTIRQNQAGRLLMIRVDQEITVYQLQAEETFKVEFRGDASPYEKVSLEYDANGDILLELESISARQKQTPSVQATISNFALCTRAAYDGTQCTATQTSFPRDTGAIYATWQSKDALAAHADFTRLWYKNGDLLFERTDTAGENSRWTPADGYSYFIYLSSTEGTGARLFNAPALPSGQYRLELLVQGKRSASIDFEVR